MLWIGGAPGVGKTTVASILARRHGLRLYSADTRTWVHRDRAVAAGNAAAIRWESLSITERRTASEADLIAMSLHGERGAMVVDDVRRLPNAPLIVAEGSVLRPQDLPQRANAVWLLADLATASDRVARRDGHPNRLYELLGDAIAADVATARAATVTVTGLVETVDEVEAVFRARLDRGPVARSFVERRALLREANLAIVDQVRGYYARPWARGDPEAVVREFICECAVRDCIAFVQAQVREAATLPVIADGHVAL